MHLQIIFRMFLCILALQFQIKDEYRMFELRHNNNALKDEYNYFVNLKKEIMPSLTPLT